MKNTRTINVLTIAASDPSGGAGIEADLKVMAAHGVFGMTAITALTVQNSQGLKQVHPTPPEVLRSVLETLTDDRPIHAVKIGALARLETVSAVADFLASLPPLPVVLDPVFCPSIGPRLLEEPGQQTIRERLLPWVTVVSPNLAEAAILTDMTVHDAAQMVRAAEKLCLLGAGAALITGGHLPGEPHDVLCYKGRIQTFSNTRIPGEYHGTGCALSTAIACGLACEKDLVPAIREAGLYLRSCIKQAVPGAGTPRILAFPKAE